MARRLGQHFLADPESARRIVAAAGIRPGDRVVEIGPGRGALTAPLIEAGARVTAVELDGRLAAELRERHAGAALALREGDFLKLDLDGLLPPAAAVQPAVKVVANLPYAVGSAILQRLLSWPRWEVAVLMFQREVADRILAEPGCADYGLLTLSVRLRAEAEPVLDVPRRSFRPPPRVDSRVVRLRPLERPRLPEGLPEERFWRAARAAFSQRRKAAAKLLAAALGAERAEVEEVLAETGLPALARAQDLPLEVYLELGARWPGGAPG